MNRFVLAVMALLFTAVTAGCNTIEGIGADIKAGGQTLEHAASH